MISALNHRTGPLLAALARLHPTARFLRIGGSSDAHRDPLRDVVLGSSWRGCIVEPIPEKAARLERIYGDTGRVSVERAAISQVDAEQTFFYDPISMTGSLRREVLYFPPKFHQDLDESIVELSTPSLTMRTLCRRRGIDGLDLLWISTAGDEAEILEQTDLERLRPTVIAVDHGLLTPQTRQAAVHRLEASGYETLDAGEYTWCLSKRALVLRDAVVLRAVWRWLELGADARVRRVLGRGEDEDAEPTVAFAVTSEERRYLVNHYDDRTPLPDGAAEQLREDNPRLLELRRSYESLDLPAVRHFLWNAATVAGNVDMRYFRGDNLYVWHRPEHPRAMALKLILHMRYLQDRGGGDLLRLLGEDGAFGCWTTEAAGYGKISRDLLDAVNEILFLDRQLGILTRTLRVLDIGAGYGRLAHRMAAAVPGLADYCCVDAVPESTFLAEYYLRHRACTPPARVVALPDVPFLEPGTFDLAINVHSFSECTFDAVSWWIDQVRRLEVPFLFVVPNEADGILSREVDGSYRSVLPALRDAGYEPIAKERVIADRVTREALQLNDNFYLFELER